MEMLLHLLDSPTNAVMCVCKAFKMVSKRLETNTCEALASIPNTARKKKIQRVVHGCAQ